VAWVRSARAAGRVTLTRCRHAEDVAIRELAPSGAAPVLRLYVTRVPITRPYFDVTPASPIAAFEAEAPRHPVFRLERADGVR
jgi:hypothetical protein